MKIIITGIASLLFCCSSLAISQQTADVCQRLWSSNVSCLKTFQYTNHHPEAARTCGRLMSDRSQISCLKAASDKVYQDYEITTCRNEWTDSSTVSCMQELGAPSLEGVLEDILADGITDILGSLINRNQKRQANSQKSTRNNRETCDLKNSNKKFLKIIEIHKLSKVAAEYAQEENSCVLSNIKNKQGSRTLFSQRGRILGQNPLYWRGKELKALIWT